jgi:hypothetical protein
MASNADGACQVFDEMSTRNQNLNFWKFLVWVIIILDRDVKYIFLGQGMLLCKNSIGI